MMSGNRGPCGSKRSDWSTATPARDRGTASKRCYSRRPLPASVSPWRAHRSSRPTWNPADWFGSFPIACAPSIRTSSCIRRAQRPSEKSRRSRSGCSSRLAAGSGQDELGDLLCVGDQRKVARVQFHGGGFHAFCKESFQVGRYRLIELRHGIPARFGAPGGYRGPLAEERGGGRFLLGIKDLRLFARNTVREILEKCVFGKIGEALVFLDACPRRHGGEHSGQRDEILRRVGRPRRNVDEGGDLRIRSGFADDGTAPGMADQHGGSILQRQRAVRRCDGVGE